MSYLLAKSSTNLAAAEQLQRDGSYCAVAHCAYYGCIQHMKYLLINRFGETEESLEAKRERTSRDGNVFKIGTHLAVIQEVESHLEAVLSFEQLQEFMTDVSDLKRLRTKSDYLDVEIVQDEGRKSIKKATKALRLLTDKFPLDEAA